MFHLDSLYPLLYKLEKRGWNVDILTLTAIVVAGRRRIMIGIRKQ